MNRNIENLKHLLNEGSKEGARRNRFVGEGIEDYWSAGFAVSVNILEDNLKDIVDFFSFVKEGIIDNSGELTNRGKKVLEGAASDVEKSVLRFYTLVFESVRDDGHDSSEDLIGSLKFDPENSEQLELLIDGHIDAEPMSKGKGDLPFNLELDSFPDAVLDIKLSFFNVLDSGGENKDLSDLEEIS